MGLERKVKGRMDQPEDQSEGEKIQIFKLLNNCMNNKLYKDFQ